MLLAPFLWIFCEFDEKVLDNLSLGRRANKDFSKGPATPIGEKKLLPFAGNPSVSHTADSSPYTGEPFGWCDATSLPFT